MLRKYEINGEAPTIRTLTIFNYGDPIKEYPEPSEDFIREQIEEFYGNGFGATNIEILDTVQFK